MYYSDFVKSGTTFVERDESYLAHHGIKGQKWGVRHDREKGIGRLFKRKKNTIPSSDLQNKNQTLDIAGLPWSLDKYGHFITYGLDVDTAIHKKDINDPETRQTLDSLVKNWDKVKTACNNAHSKFASEVPEDLGISKTTSGPDRYDIHKDIVVATYFHDYGVVSIEVDPSTQKVYYTTYDD
jgi:hypothetical protein